MELKLNHIGSFGGNPSTIIELTVTDGNASIMSEITGLNSTVDECFIDNLREIANTLEEQNRMLKES